MKKNKILYLICFCVFGFFVFSACGNKNKEKESTIELSIKEIMLSAENIAAADEYVVSNTKFIINVDNGSIDLKTENNDMSEVIVSEWKKNLGINDGDKIILNDDISNSIIIGVVQNNGSVKWQASKSVDISENDTSGTSEVEPTPTDVVTEEITPIEKKYDYNKALPMNVALEWEGLVEIEKIEESVQSINEEESEYISEDILKIYDMMTAADKVAAEDENIATPLTFCIDCHKQKIEAAILANSDNPENDEHAYKKWVEYIGYSEFEPESSILSTLQGRIYGELKNNGSIVWHRIGSSNDYLCIWSSSFNNLFAE